MRVEVTLALIAFAGIFICCNAKVVVKDNKNPVTVHYHLWFDHEPQDDNETRLLPVDSVHHSTFFDVMNIADDLHEDYVFEYIEYPFGNYITSIGGKPEIPEENIYWMIYDLKDHPSLDNPPGDQEMSPVGVDGILVEHDDIYLFWRKKVAFHQNTIKFQARNTIIGL